MDFMKLLKRIGRVVEEATVEVERDMGINQMWSRVNAELVSQYDGWVWVDDIYRATSGDLYAIVVRDGKLWQHAITVNGADIEMGEAVEVEVQFAEVSRTFRTVRQKDGTMRWFAIAATSTLNRVAEIDSRDLFDDFKQRVDDGEEDYPYLTVVHTDRALEIGQADFLWREKNTYINSGVWDFEGENEELARAFAAATESDADGTWGISIGFIPLKREILTINGDIEIPVYTRGIHVETSILLEKDAANNLTTVANIERNMVMASKALKDALDVLFDGDKDVIEAQLEKVDGANRTIDRAQMITRDGEAEPEAEPDVDPEPVFEADEEELVVEITEEIEQAIARRVTQNLLKSMEKQQRQIDTLTQAVETLTQTVETEQKAREKAEERLAAVEREDDKKAQDIISNLPRATTVKVHRPRSSQGAEEETPEPLSLGAIAGRTLEKLGAD